MRTKSAITIQDVAAAAGVSVSTVSRVLNDKDDVAPQTAERVREVIRELGYASSLAARSMRSQRTNVIGLIVPDMDHSYVVEVIKGVSRAITETSYDLIAVTSGRKSHEARGPWEERQVMRLNGSIADGIIIVTPDAAEFRTEYPVVAVDPYRQTSTYPFVIAASYEGAIQAMEHLLGLGHRRIAFLSGVAHLQSNEWRRQGYEAALHGAGIAVDPQLIQAANFTRPGGFAATQRLLRLDEPPTAIFAANDDSALGAVAAIQQAGLSVPEDVSVIGFDNVPEAAMTQPALTTVDQSVALMGETAVRMLIDLIEGRPLAEQVVSVPTALVVRQSCAPRTLYLPKSRARRSA